MGRAVGLRAALVFGPLVVLMVIVAASPGYKPWAVILVFFGVFGLFGLIIFTRTDRKLKADLGKPDAPWAGAYASALPVDTDLSPETALEIARQCIVQLRARDVRTIGGHTAVGWVGSVLTNVPQWQAYEVAVVILVKPDGMTQMVCCARPRFSIAYFGAAKSRDLAGQLQQAVLSRR
jgi:hypothetical protein